MNMLVIGNGFDLALGLPTRYSDFLNFVQAFDEVIIQSYSQNIEKNVSKAIAGKWEFDSKCSLTDEEKNSHKKNIDEIFGKNNAIFSSIDKSIINDFKSCVFQNLWIDYFEKIYSQNIILGENWIDIEQEIRRVIETLEMCTGFEIKKDRIFRFKTPLDSKYTISYFMETSKKDGNENNQNSHATLEQVNLSQFIQFKETLRGDFKKLIMAFGIYLDVFIRALMENRCLPLSLKNFIITKNIELDYVLSFNYVDNFSPLYKIELHGKCKTHYVHGETCYLATLQKCRKKHLNSLFDSDNPRRLNKIIQKNTMIIGFDEYWEDKDKNERLGFVYYRKYFQRIAKCTGEKYLIWLDGKQERKFKKRNQKANRVYIFGHSLDATDKDIFQKIFRRNDTRVTIFYHDDDAKERIIVNLIRMLGQDTLIEKTHGKEPDIEFVAQSDYE